MCISGGARHWKPDGVGPVAPVAYGLKEKPPAPHQPDRQGRAPVQESRAVRLRFFLGVLNISDDGMLQRALDLVESLAVDRDVKIEGKSLPSLRAQRMRDAKKLMLRFFLHTPIYAHD